MKFKIILVTTLCLLVLQVPSEAVDFKPGQYHEELVHDGVHRSYILHIPPQYDSKKRWPVVLLFHGGGGNAKQALHTYGLVKKANLEGFILVAPNGTGFFKNKLLTWNVKFGFGYAKRKNIDDIGLAKKLMTHLESHLSIDPKRIFATGISNGGIFCHFLAAHASDKIAAIAPIAASIGGKERSDEKYILPPPPNQPVSVIAFNGFIDKHIPYSGGLQKKSIGSPLYISSAQAMASFWTKVNRCASVPQIKVNKLDRYKIVTYSQGLHQSEVVQYIILNQGHAWPGGKKPRFMADTPSQTVNATDLMWAFFKKHPKK